MSGKSVEPVTLEGTRVRMEPIGFHHVDGLVAAIGSDRSSYGLTWVPDPTVESVTAYVQAALNMQAAGTALPFATVRKSDGRACGSTRLGNIEFYPLPTGVVQPPEVMNRVAPEAAEIGWTWLGAEYQRSPINTEAKLLMLTHAFETWQVLRLTLKTDSRNQRSRNNIERIGATFEGILRNHQYAYGGGMRHSAMYSITLDEWPQVKANLLAKIASYDSP
jgi:N-acetyltransferase